MRNLLLVLPLLVSVSCAVPRNYSYRVGTGGTSAGLINGVSAAILFPDYWTPPEVLQFLELDGTDAEPIAQYDPLQSTKAFYDEVTNRPGILATLDLLRTEWDTASYKYAGSFTNSYYLSPTGSDSGAGTIGDPWKTLVKARDYIEANHLDVGGNLDAATEVVLLPGTHYLVADSQRTNHATVNLNNIIGTASKPLVFRGSTGDMTDVLIRVDHDYLATNFDGFGDVSFGNEIGFRLVNSTSYVELWDVTMVGMQYEANYRDGTGGNSAGFWTYSYDGTGGNKVINCELTQFQHCGVKGKKINIYGNYIHNIGSSGHDHGLYASDQSDGQTCIGNIVININGCSLMAREPNENAVLFIGNIVGHSGLWDGAGAQNIRADGVGSIVAHNVFLEGNEDYAVFIGGDNTNVTNNVFYTSKALAGYGASGNYIRPTGFVWQNNAKLSTRSAPTSIPTLYAWAEGVVFDNEYKTLEANGHRYKTPQNGAISGLAATAGNAPTHTDGSSQVNADGDEFLDIGTATASYGSFTDFVVATDFNDAANFDFRPATESALLSAGTDIGYGTTIGAFNAAP